jgi:hypothetical protein
LCHGAEANNGLARCTLTERRIRTKYAFGPGAPWPS